MTRLTNLPPPNAKDLAVNEEIPDAEAWKSGTVYVLSAMVGAHKNSRAR